MNAEVVALAAKMYHAAAPCHPTWDQLGGVTQAVWLERAAEILYGDFA